jgi:predicted enzyme related to lactoylglutathione lyase
MKINYKRIIWLGIFVEDLENSIKFYEEILELNLLGLNESYAHFDAGGGSLLELFSGGKKAPSVKSPKKQSCMAALRVDNLELTKSILKEKGVVFTENEGTFKNMHWATLVDPEGNCIEIKQIDSLR